MRRLRITSLPAFHASEASRHPRQSFGGPSEFTYVTACQFAAGPRRASVRRAPTSRLPDPAVSEATEANRQFLGRDFNSQDNDTFRGARGRLRILEGPRSAARDEDRGDGVLVLQEFDQLAYSHSVVSAPAGISGVTV